MVYPFGMMMPGRSFSAENGYRYGFNGKENDNEVKGEGNSVDFGARIYDSRIGRWLSADPLETEFAFVSTYNYVLNNPINYVDPDGMKVKYEQGKDVSDPQFRNMKIRIFALRILSKTFRVMYRDLKNADETYTFKSVTSISNANFGQYIDASKTIEISATSNGKEINFHNKALMYKSLQKIGHEVGHAWRDHFHLDKPMPADYVLPGIPIVGILDSPAEVQRKWTEYNNKIAFESKENAERSVEAHEGKETGGMEIENLVASELIRHSFLKKFLELRSNYGSRLVVTSVTAGNITRYTISIDSSDGGYSAFKNFSREFFSKRQNIHQMYHVSPVKKH